MKARKRAQERRRLYEDAVARLQAHGFSLLLQPNNLSFTATAPCGRVFHHLPSAKKWHERGTQAPTRQTGSIVAFLRLYAEETAAARGVREEWDSLRPDLTIFTDAALCPATGAGGWGAWMKGGGSRSVTAGGQIAELCTSSTEVEIRAGANAFAVARNRGLLLPGSVVMWQCDNLSSLRWLLGEYPLSRDRPARGGLPAHQPKKRTEAQAKSAGARALANLCAELELRVLTRHVKGHLEGPNRQWVNRLCDQIAAEHMRDRRVLHYSSLRTGT